MTSAPLFLVDALPDGERAVLDGAEGRHAATVRRLRPGERLVLGDGAGGLADCTVAEVGTDRLTVTVHRRWHEPPPQPRFVVAQAPPKGDRAELAVELMTEVGVDEVVPWTAERAVVRWHGERAGRAMARWRSTAREAAKQSRRAWLPVVAEPHGTPEVAARIAAASGAVVLNASADTALAAVPLPNRGDLVVVVGPEGGFTDDEVGAFTAAGARPVRLGPTVLRTSTAGAAALAVLAVRTGRWS